MSFPVTFALIVAGLVVSARVRLEAVLFGLRVDIPWLAVLFAVLILALVALILGLIRAILADRPVRESRPESRPVYVITSAR